MHAHVASSDPYVLRGRVASNGWLDRRTGSGIDGLLGLIFFYSRQTKDTVNYCVLINKLLELAGDELIQLGEKQQQHNVRRTNNFT